MFCLYSLDTFVRTTFTALIHCGLDTFHVVWSPFGLTAKMISIDPYISIATGDQLLMNTDFTAR